MAAGQIIVQEGIRAYLLNSSILKGKCFTPNTALSARNWATDYRPWLQLRVREVIWPRIAEATLPRSPYMSDLGKVGWFRPFAVDFGTEVMGAERECSRAQIRDTASL